MTDQGGTDVKKPTDRQMNTTLDVLLWLHERSVGNGALRDKITAVRSALFDTVEP